MMTPLRSTHADQAARAVRSLLLFLTVTLLVAFASAGTAQADDEGERPKGSVGVSYVYVFEDTSFQRALGSVDDGHGVSFWMDYRWNGFFASTVRAEYANGFQYAFLGDDVRSEVFTGTLGGKIYPLAGVTDAIDHVVEPFIELGGGFAWAQTDLPDGADTKEAGFVGRFSGGVDVNLTDTIGLVGAVTYVLPTGEAYDYRYYSVSTGVQYRF